ncbi:uncharacterized protein LOC120667515 [Panicum virgatum]|uniref:uncharacterized protein LOC120667515 n=1 Tax=Panicum virgatum TaxID=38727 RepID=UPI0019D523AF|nr:uncharacterized protein LOC120667515 [Panicum virgatum]
MDLAVAGGRARPRPRRAVPGQGRGGGGLRAAAAAVGGRAPRLDVVAVGTRPPGRRGDAAAAARPPSSLFPVSLSVWQGPSPAALSFAGGPLSPLARQVAGMAREAAGLRRACGHAGLRRVCEQSAAWARVRILPGLELPGIEAMAVGRRRRPCGRIHAVAVARAARVRAGKALGELRAAAGRRPRRAARIGAEAWRGGGGSACSRGAGLSSGARRPWGRWDRGWDTVV